MKNKLSLLMAFAFMLTTFFSNAQAPIIDREIFFGNPKISGSQLSPNGEFLAFQKEYNGKMNVWVKKTTDSFDKALPVTNDEKRNIPGYFWSRSGKYIVYVQDDGGNENFHLFKLNPTEAKEGVVPKAIDMTPGAEVRARFYGSSEVNDNLVFVGLNDRDAAWHDLYSIDLETGVKTLIKENTAKIAGWDLDNNDKLRLASRSTDNSGTEIMKVTKDGFETILDCKFGDQIYAAFFDKDNKGFYYVSNVDSDISSLNYYDLTTGKTKFIEKDPENKVDFGGARVSRITKEIQATYYTGAKTRTYFKDKNYEKLFNAIKARHPNAEVYLSSPTLDEKMYKVTISSDTKPADVYLYYVDKEELELQYQSRPEINAEYMAPMTPITYKSSDGLEIPAYLTVPNGVEAKNLPLVALVHGGPWARDRWGFNSYAQFLANRGYAVLSMNFRGSTGYGKAFLNAGNKEWGLKMQDDITWGVKHLVKEGIVDENKVAIMGGSYGGYATLAGMTFTPEVYKCGVSIVGPSNLFTLLESIPPYWESFRTTMYKRMGDPNTEAGKKVLKAASPFFHADNIKAPILIIQGANDPRVKKTESDQIVVAMRNLKLPVEYLCAPDEGHGFHNEKNKLAMQATIEKFLASHLGGRYQKEMKDDVASKLNDITVDINTVEMPKVVAAMAVGSDKLVFNKKIKTDELKYKMTIEMGPQKMEMDVVRTIQNKDGQITISDITTSPMGSGSDIYILDAKTLAPVSRSVKQGPVVIKIKHEGDKIKGNMSMQGKDMPFDITKDKMVYGDNGAMDITVANLDLKLGFIAEYNVFDVQMQKLKAFKLEVTGEETIGKYDCFVVKMTGFANENDSKINWISKKDAKLIKSEQVMAAMGGAKATMMLVD